MSEPKKNGTILGLHVCLYKGSDAKAMVLDKQHLCNNVGKMKAWIRDQIRPNRIHWDGKPMGVEKKLDNKITGSFKGGSIVAVYKSIDKTTKGKECKSTTK